MSIAVDRDFVNQSTHLWGLVVKTIGNPSSFSEVDLLLFSPKFLSFPSVFPSPEIFNKDYF
jgi:hypothetical protein